MSFRPSPRRGEPRRRPSPLEGRTFREAGLDEALCRRGEALVEETLEMDGPKGPRLYDCRVVEGPRSTGLLALCRDVTESRETETNYRLLFESMRDACALCEGIEEGGKTVDFRFLDVNPAFEKETGLSREVVGKPLLDLFPHDDPFWAEVCGDVVRTGEARRFTRFIPPSKKSSTASSTGRSRATAPSSFATSPSWSGPAAGRNISARSFAPSGRSTVSSSSSGIGSAFSRASAIFSSIREATSRPGSPFSTGRDGSTPSTRPAPSTTRRPSGPPSPQTTFRPASGAVSPARRSSASPLLCSGCTLQDEGNQRRRSAARLEGRPSLRGLLSVAAPEGFEPDEEERTLFREVADDVDFALSLLDDDAAKRKAREELASSFLKVRRAQEGTIAVLSRMVESRDVYTAGHQERVARLALALARRMGLTSETQEAVFMAGRLHDVGKIRVPSEILNKPGRLSPLELAIVREHPQSGWEILRDIDFPWPVADVVEAMSAHRPYRSAPGLEAALDEIRRGAGTIYDERVVTACFELFRKGFDFDGENPFISS
ncbi:HD domain-containing protein [Aminithiophilus ramosus]|uniref:HD domain-containing protein n=1 Tax=Aminithiophilus ramosus TaxID=3029084 RepID=A0A9Q7EWZ4_9BACT|nr:HD domain-containing phosphohydrolase [Aminithiophilus ramosus]QTX32050.1 HD domain-containing protein [Aminithiophilus ramosus]